MRLFHTTTRAGCVRIADRGFEESRAGKYGPGVYLSQGYVLRTPKTALVLDPELGNAGLDSDAVVLAFEVPEAVAEETGCGGTVTYPPGHPEYDPELDDHDDGPDEPPDEWVLTAAQADGYCVGPVCWAGEPPLTPAQLGTLLSRSSVPRP